MTPPLGVATYPAVAEAASTVLTALKDAVSAGVTPLPDSGLVSIVPGYVYPQLSDDQVTVEWATSTLAEGGTNGTGRREHHDLQLTVTLDVQRITDDELVTIDRALALLAAVEDQVRRTDPTLGGTALWCRMSESRMATSTEDSDAWQGRVTEIAATFECRVIVVTR